MAIKNDPIYNLSTVEMCEQFMHIYDEKIDELLRESEREIYTSNQINYDTIAPLKRDILSLPKSLAKQLLEKIGAISQDVLDPEIGILHHFDNLDLSKETKEYLRNLNEQIQTAIRNSSDVGKTVEAIKRDLSQLAQHKVADQILEEKEELKN